MELHREAAVRNLQHLAGDAVTELIRTRREDLRLLPVVEGRRHRRKVEGECVLPLRDLVVEFRQVGADVRFILRLFRVGEGPDIVPELAVCAGPPVGGTGNGCSLHACHGNGQAVVGLTVNRIVPIPGLIIGADQFRVAAGTAEDIDAVFTRVVSADVPAARKIGDVERSAGRHKLHRSGLALLAWLLRAALLLEDDDVFERAEHEAVDVLAVPLAGLDLHVAQVELQGEAAVRDGQFLGIAVPVADLVHAGREDLRGLAVGEGCREGHDIDGNGTLALRDLVVEFRQVGIGIRRIFRLVGRIQDPEIVPELAVRTGLPFHVPLDGGPGNACHGDGKDIVVFVAHRSVPAPGLIDGNDQARVAARTAENVDPVLGRAGATDVPVARKGRGIQLGAFNDLFERSRITRLPAVEDDAFGGTALAEGVLEQEVAVVIGRHLRSGAVDRDGRRLDLAGHFRNDLGIIVTDDQLRITGPRDLQKDILRHFDVLVDALGTAAHTQHATGTTGASLGDIAVLGAAFDDEFGSPLGETDDTADVVGRIRAGIGDLTVVGAVRVFPVRTAFRNALARGIVIRHTRIAGDAADTAADVRIAIGVHLAVVHAVGIKDLAVRLRCTIVTGYTTYVSIATVTLPLGEHLGIVDAIDETDVRGIIDIAANSGNTGCLLSGMELDDTVIDAVFNQAVTVNLGDDAAFLGVIARTETGDGIDDISGIVAVPEHGTRRNFAGDAAQMVSDTARITQNIHGALAVLERHIGRTLAADTAGSSLSTLERTGYLQILDCQAILDIGKQARTAGAFLRDVQRVGHLVALAVDAAPEGIRFEGRREFDVGREFHPVGPGI